MERALTIRNCKEGDIHRLIEIWHETGITLGVSDTPAELVKFLEHNPGTFLVGEYEGQVVATVMGGFDGRRGLVHHLAVEPEYQRMGFGKVMMEEIERRFKRKGVVKFHMWIEAGNKLALDFYERLGYEVRDLTTVSKTLRK